MGGDRLHVSGNILFGRLIPALLVSALAVQAWAMPASPHAFNVIQPDGTVISLLVRGDEYFHWWEDRDGFTVVQDRAEKYVYAAVGAAGALVPTGWAVGSFDPQDAGLTRRILPAREIRKRLAESEATARGAASAALPPTTGGVKNVVILLQFSDHENRTLPPLSTYDTVMNAVGGHPTIAPTGSVRDVYLEDSYGQLAINSTVFGWYLLPQTEEFYAHGNSGLGSPKTYITDALDLADADIDFSQFDDDNDGFVDAIAFLHSGYGAEFGGTDVDGTAQADRIWSHRSGIPTWTSDEGIRVSPYHISAGLWGTSGSQPARIGVICHETGHFFGLPDLYDTNGGGSGIGSYGMMANSWGFPGDQRFPPRFCPWSKIGLGWASPTVISAPGVYSLPQSATNPSIFRIDAGYPSNEYLLIENRQPVGHESAMPQGGLAVWHIDNNNSFSTEGFPGQAGWPENGKHYRVALLQADGAYNLEHGAGRGDGGDVYHGGADGVDALSAASQPNTNAYQGGNILSLGHSIWQISQADETMTFRLGPVAPESAPPPMDTPKNRFVSFSPGNDGSSVAIRVELTDRVCDATGKKCAVDGDCFACVGGDNAGAGCSINSDCSGGATCVQRGEACDDQTQPIQLGWVGEPFEPPAEGTPPATLTALVVASQPVLRTWGEETIHLGDCEIAPVQTYALSATSDGSTFSPRFHIRTIEKPQGKAWADLVGSFDGSTWDGPNGLLNVNDVLAWINFKTFRPAPHVTVLDLGSEQPNFVINATDLGLVLQAFQGRTYPPPAFSNQGRPDQCP